MILDNFDNRVFNKINETNLEYIGIFGLFGRYNVEIPFYKQVNIFIGENGLGKTTILNCIYFVLEKKFSELLKIQFSEIKIRFQNNPKLYKVSFSGIQEYLESKNTRPFQYMRNDDFYLDHVISDRIKRGTLIYDDAGYQENKIENIIYELANDLDIPSFIIRNKVMQIINGREELVGKSKRKKNVRDVIELIKAISENITNRIIYLPTYRRIEDDFESLDIRSEELNNAELLIRFGMSDVQIAIDRILDKIRSLAMTGFTEMTGVLLKQYAEGDFVKNIIYNDSMIEGASDIVKIVLDRVGKAIEQNDKDRILRIVQNGKIFDYEYLYLNNLLNKLIENYGLQKRYDDRIKKFADTCNKYLNDKYFYYNQSTLSLEIILDNTSNEEKQVIQLTQLSSGEKQIVSLFSKLYLESDEKSIIIIDEPELSLSLSWQKMLLPDIIRTDNCNILLTVTHSPFIFENEFDYDAQEIRKYIKTY